MSIFFTPDDRPCCKFCGQVLPGYSLSGHCPHCGKWYAIGRATIMPSRARAISLLWQAHRAAARQQAVGWTGLAAAILFTGNAAMVILLGRMAVKALWHACGVP